MDKFYQFYDQYSLLKKKWGEEGNDISVDLLQYGITKDYYEKVRLATDLLFKLYNTKLLNVNIRNSVSYKLNDNHADNTKVCVLIDVLRCYDGLGHPTSFTTPEGIAIMILLDKMLGKGEISTYEQLRAVCSTTLSLIDLIPYISECSDVLGQKYSLCLSVILEKKARELDGIYRRLIYNLCKRIAEVDGEITASEQEWLNEIALLNDDNPDNDIDIKGL